MCQLACSHTIPIFILNVLIQIPVQYEVVGDKFKALEGTYRVKIQVGTDESYGGGGSISEAKQAAALQVAFRLSNLVSSSFKTSSYCLSKEVIISACYRH